MIIADCIATCKNYLQCLSKIFTWLADGEKLMYLLPAALLFWHDV